MMLNNDKSRGSQKGWRNETYETTILMDFKHGGKRQESIEFDRSTCMHMPSGTNG